MKLLLVLIIAPATFIISNFITPLVIASKATDSHLKEETRNLNHALKKCDPLKSNNKTSFVLIPRR